MRTRILVMPVLAMLVPAGAAALCAGDCDRDGRVHIAELMRGIGCVVQCVGCCEENCHDADGDGVAAVNEMILAINNALYGCPP